MNANQNSSADPTPPGNPFATRHVKPGALEFVFAPGPKAQQLVQRLADTGGWGQITGPHGTGKSSLLETLEPHFRAAGWTPVRFALHDGQRRLPPRWKTTVCETAAPRKAIVVVDGFEQLGWLAASQLQRTCRRRDWGLLITAHGDMGLPTLYRTASSLKLVDTLIDRLFPPGGGGQIDRTVIREVFEQHDGNLRDIFFALFDHYERHCRHND